MLKKLINIDCLWIGAPDDGTCVERSVGPRECFVCEMKSPNFHKAGSRNPHDPTTLAVSVITNVYSPLSTWKTKRK